MSPTPLAGKLGIRPGTRLLLLGELDLGPLPPEVTLNRRAAGPAPYNVIIVLCPDAATLHRRVPPLVGRVSVAGGLWIGWPKRASGVATDLGDQAVRGFGLGLGLVDNKVAALNEVWSGLRFVRRLRDRP